MTKRTRTRATPTSVPDAIWLSDPHMRIKNPVCRQDDIIEAQARKWAVIRGLEEKYGCPVIIGGDLFDKWEYGKKTSWLITLANAWLPKCVITVAGQHDLPAHSFDRLYESPLGVLEAMGRVTVLGAHPSVRRTWTDGNIVVYGYSWGDAIEDIGAGGDGHPKAMAVLHHLVYTGAEPYPGAEESGSTARALMKKLKSFPAILTGDHHRAFSVHGNGRLLVNPGSLLRTTADQIDHQPGVFLWYADKGRVQQVQIPVETDIISREHVEEEEERDARLEAFISRLRHDVELGVSFESNMREYCAKNKVPKRVQVIIEEVME